MDRSYLKFPETVEEQFSFLKENGFHIKERDQTFVRYESKEVFINVYHGRTSFEIGLEIGLVKSGKETGYGLSSLISIADKEKGNKYQQYMTSKPEGVVKGVTELAELFRKYGKKAVYGEPDTFKELQKDIDRYWDEIRARQIRPKAEAAFREKDYKNAVIFYQSMESCLLPSEQKKLKFAQKKLTNK